MIKPIIIAELRNGKGTVSDVTRRLRAQGYGYVETQVHAALRGLVDSGSVMTHIVAMDNYAYRDGDEPRKHGREPEVNIYELADGGEWKEVG